MTRKGWPHESYRHSMASRGIVTKCERLGFYKTKRNKFFDGVLRHGLILQFSVKGKNYKGFAEKHKVELFNITHLEEFAPAVAVKLDGRLIGFTDSEDALFILLRDNEIQATEKIKSQIIDDLRQYLYFDESTGAAYRPLEYLHRFVPKTDPQYFDYLEFVQHHKGVEYALFADDIKQEDIYNVTTPPKVTFKTIHEAEKFAQENKLGKVNIMAY